MAVVQFIMLLFTTGLVVDKSSIFNVTRISLIMCLLYTPRELATRIQNINLKNVKFLTF